MDRNAKRFQLLGAFGIVAEAFKIIHSQPKLLGNITLAFILPLALINLVHGMTAQYLAAEIIGQVQYSNLDSAIMKLIELLVLQAVYPLLSYKILMPSMAAVMYTVTTADNDNNKPSLAGAMKLVPPVWKGMMIITCLWCFLIHFQIYMAVAFGLCLLALGSVELGDLYASMFHVAISIVITVFIRVSVHLRMVWQVASVGCVIEDDYYGFEGMKKSHRLLEGKRITALYSTLYARLTARKVSMEISMNTRLSTRT
ncbi:hypothetical protein SUGI_1197300 [Cryptomeria japonica]|nr:hypothetical protein SUGI_1197300 [Cryptomeria japonica]